MRRALISFGHAGDIVGATGGQLVPASGCLTSYSVRNADSSAHNITIYDGASANGQYLWELTVPASSSLGPFTLGLHRLSFVEGLYFAAFDSHLEGSLIAWLDHDCEHWLNQEHHAVRAEIVQAAIEVAELAAK